MQFYWGDIPSTVHSEWDLPKKVIVFYIVKLSKKFFLYLCDREKKELPFPILSGGGNLLIYSKLQTQLTRTQTN